MRRLPLASLALIPVLAILACGGGLWLAVFGGSLIPLRFSPDQLPDAQTDEAYQVSLLVSRNNTPVGRIEIVAGWLPVGMTLSHTRSQNTAIISGTPVSAGRYCFTVRASCLGTQVDGRSGQQAYTLVVK